MNNYKIILFDLDGTISDPKVGITKSVQYALQKMNIYESNLDKLDCFIGPPLQVSFADYYHFNEEDNTKAIAFYRERFKEKGMYENELYPGIPQLLHTLKQQGFILGIATSKPTVFAEQILAYFKIDHFFDFVVGSNLDGTRSSKAEIIAYILNMYSSYKKEAFLMIGDRKYDILGANDVGIQSIGVLYGYGSIEELEKSSPTYIVSSIEEIEGILIGSTVRAE
ncbi:MAG: HAD family hydrolase [Bacillaceae bacterium]